MLPGRAHLRPLVVSTLCVAALAACGEPTSEVEPKPRVEEPAPAAAPASPAPGELSHEWTLDEPTRAYLWDMEHHAKVLGAHGFAPLTAALAAGDRDALSTIVATNFDGDTMREPKTIALTGGDVDGTRQELSETAGSEPLSREGFLEFLMGMRARFEGPPRIGFGVQKIFPLEREDLAGPWSILCVLNLRGEADGGSPTEYSCLLRLRTAQPTEERLDEPGWLLGCSVLQVTSTTAPRYLFEDVTATVGLDAGRLHDNWESERVWNVTGGVFACDFDRDGCADMLLTDVRPGGNTLYRGRPDGTFEDVTSAVGLLALRRRDAELQAAFADLDDDGWVDLVLADGQIFRNVDGERFESVTARSNLRALLGNPEPSSLSVADVDRDGRVDLYVARSGGLPTSYLEDTKDAHVRSLLLLNRGDFRFEDVTAASGADGGARSVFTAVWFDADDDGWPDLYVSNEFGDGALYRSEEGKTFRELDVDESTDDFGAMGAATGDIDNDGHIDLYVAAMYSKAGSRILRNMPPEAYPEHVMKRLRRLISGSELYRNHGDLRFTASGREAQVHAVGWAWGAALADFDNDGWVDTYATAGYISRDRAKPDG